jgi:ribosome-binding factor A
MKKVKNLVSGTDRSSITVGSPAPVGQGTKPSGELAAMREVVAEPREGDGVDPRLEAKRRRRDPGEPRLGFTHGVHQQERLASQIQVALDLALQAAATPLLNELTVREVVKDGGSLAVVLAPRNPTASVDVAAATEAVNRASSMLRREVAAAITRKEVPNLSFVVLPGGAEKVED